MAIRFQAFVRFQVGSGMASWAESQMQVRLGQAFHLREGSPEEELSHVTTDLVAGQRENLMIDVLWPDGNEALAQDTVNTLFDPSVVAWVKPDEPGDGKKSWARWHHCNHESEPPETCTGTDWKWSL